MISPRRRFSLTVFICSLLSACASPKPLEMSGRMPAEAVARAKDGDHLALTELQNAAHGAGAAEYAIGLGMAEGWAGQKDLEQALVWWQRAAEHGNADAKNALAVAHAEGLNGPRDLTLARDLWQQAAEQGNANAQYNLASLLVATGADRGGHGHRRRLAAACRRRRRSGRADTSSATSTTTVKAYRASRRNRFGCGGRRRNRATSSPSSAWRRPTCSAPSFPSTWPRPRSGCAGPPATDIRMRRNRLRCWRGVRFRNPRWWNAGLAVRVRFGTSTIEAEPSAPKFKAPPAVHRDVAAAEPAPARAKVPQLGEGQACRPK